MIYGRFHGIKSTLANTVCQAKLRVIQSPRIFALLSFPDLVAGRHALLHQISKSPQAETADIDLAFAVDDLLRQRLADGRRVLESMT